MRNTDEKLQSRSSSLFASRTATVTELISQSYPLGLSRRAFDLALRGLLRISTSMSAATVAIGAPSDGSKTVMCVVLGYSIRRLRH